MEELSDMIRERGHKVRRLRRFGMSTNRPRIHTTIAPLGGVECWGVHNNSLPNLERALTERVFTVKGGVLPPKPDRQFLMRCLQPFAMRLRSHVGLIDKLTTKEFVESYVGRKRALYERAAESLENQPLESKDAIVQAFIKDEKVNLTRKDDPCPRIIQPRAARYNIEIGKYLKPLEKAIFRGIAGVFREVTVLKGYNAVERAHFLHTKWKRFDVPVAVLLDAERFDQHVSRDLLDWEQATFGSMLVDRDGFDQVNALRRVNKCYARAEGAGFGYSLNGVRMSGDMDTALGNCMSMCAMTWSFMNWIGVRKYSYANDGDDGVLIIESSELQTVLEQFPAFFKRLGFTMKLEGLARIFEQIEFCQSRPVFDGKGYRMVRVPDIALMKDSLTLRKGDIASIANAVGWGGLALCGTIPICWKYYLKMINSEDNRAGPSECGRDFLAERLDPYVSPPTLETRVSFYEAFGISPDEQVVIEATIDHKIHALGPFDYPKSISVGTVCGDSSLRWW